MGRLSQFLLTFIAVIILASSAAATYRPNPQERVFGHLEHRVNHDTLYISYNLTIQGGAVQVILEPLFILPEPVDGPVSTKRLRLVIYSKDSAATESLRGYTERSTSRGLRLKGKVSVLIYPSSRVRGCSVKASGVDNIGEWSDSKWVEFSPIGTLSLSLLPPIGGAWYKSTLDSSTAKKGVAFGIEFYASLDIGHFRFEPSYHLTIDDDFTAKEAVPIAVQYYFGNRTDFLPSFFAAPKYSTLHTIKDKVDFEEKEWGVETGLAIEGPFERLSYSYCSGLGGYHKASLYLSVFRAGSWTGGTRYEYYHYDNTEMFRVMGVIEGFPMGGGAGIGHGATDLSYLNNRPIPHKVLAYAGMAPLLAAMFLLNAITTH